MGTVVTRRRRGGTIAHHAQISIMRDRKIVLRETKTFDRPQAANAWIKKREKELEKPEALEEAITAKKHGSRSATLAVAIDRMVAESEKEIGRTKAQVLKSIKEFEIADLACD